MLGLTPAVVLVQAANGQMIGNTTVHEVLGYVAETLGYDCSDSDPRVVLRCVKTGTTDVEGKGAPNTVELRVPQEADNCWNKPSWNFNILRRQPDRKPGYASPSY